MALKSPEIASRPFHILSIEGPPKTGKTALASKAPGKVAIQSTEGGWDGVIQQIHPDNWKDRFLVANYVAEVDLSADELFRDGDRDQSKVQANLQADRVNQKLWLPFTKDYREGLAEPTVKTTVWDLAGEFNEYLRIANFGKLEKNPQIAYGPINMEYKNLIRQSIKAQKNLIMVHEVKQAYKTVTDPDSGREKSVEDQGRFKRVGNDSVHYLVHSYVRTKKYAAVRDAAGNVTAPPRFFVEVMEARLNPEANGAVLENPDWVTLMMVLAPSVDPEAWGE